MNAVFNNFYAGINTYHLSFGYRQEKLKTNFGWGLTYLDYGKISETDASGNLMGSVKPTDWVMQVSASRSYLENGVMVPLSNLFLPTMVFTVLMGSPWIWGFCTPILQIFFQHQLSRRIWAIN